MLTLKKLILDGFISYGKEVEIPLDVNGITYIKGNSGVGKSTIFEGIIYALFGKTIRKKDSVSLLSNKYLNENCFSVQLEFMVDNDFCVVKEVRNKSKTDLSFLINGKNCSDKNANATRKRVQDKIGITFDAFRSFIVFGQRQAQQLVEGSASERLDILIDVFNLNKYDEYLNKSLAYLKKLEAKKEKIEQEIEYIDVDLKKYEIPDLSVTIDQVTEQIQENESKLAELNQTYFECRQKIAIQAKIDIIVNDLRNCENEIGILQSMNLDKESQNKSKQYGDTYLYLKEEFTELVENSKLFNSNTCPLSRKPCLGSVPTDIIKTKYKIDSYAELQIIVEDYSNYLKSLEEKRSFYEKNAKHLIRLSSLLDKQNNLKGTYNLLTNQSKIESDIDYAEEAVKLDAQVKEVKAELFSLKKTFEQLQLYETTQKLLANKEERSIFLKDELKKHIEVCKLANASTAIFKKLKFYKLSNIIDCLTYEVNCVLEKINESIRIQFLSNKETITTKKTVDQVNMIVHIDNMELPVNMVSDGQRTIISIATMLGIIQTAYKLSKFRMNTIFLDEPFNTLPDAQIITIFESICDLSKSLDLGIKIISHRELNHQLVDAYFLIDRVEGISNLKVIVND